MNSQEIKEELKLSYKDLVAYLLKKYGGAKCDYFTTPACIAKNKNASRTAEGLFCHHIDEDKAIMLSNDKFAIDNPFEYQKADRLVYCNYIEHLLLHIKIAEEPRNKNANEHELPGIGGAVNYICREINDYFNGYPFKTAWKITANNLIKENYNDYIMLLKYLWNVILCNEHYIGRIRKEQLCFGWNGQVIDKIYKDLCK